MRIQVYSHNFAVTGYDNVGYRALKDFMMRYVEYERERTPPSGSYFWGATPQTPEVMHYYVSVTNNRREFRFHINQMTEFLEDIKERGIKYEIEHVPLYKPDYIEQKILPKFVARADQQPYIDYIKEPGVTKILNLPTGFGKTYCSLEGASSFNSRIVVTIEPKFFHIWREALEGNKQILDIDIATEAVFIKGTKELVKFLNLAMLDAIGHIKIVLISAATIVNFIRAYERYNGEIHGLYPIKPIELYELLSAIRLKDEVHKGIYANYCEELHLHCPTSINMSATLKDGSFKDKIIDIMFPKEWAPLTEVTREPYIDCCAIMYNFKDLHGIRYTRRGSSDYSHMAFEEFLLKDPSRKANYFRLIGDWLKQEYLTVKVDKQRACIFVSSVEMATQLKQYLENLYPEVEFARYAASTGDNYDEAKEKDVLVTTIQSFGVGYDLDDLLVSLMTTAISSPKTNEQTLGRTREMKRYPGTHPRFFYFVCLDIPKHVSYHKDKQILFIGKVRSHIYRRSNILI